MSGHAQWSDAVHPLNQAHERALEAYENQQYALALHTHAQKMFPCEACAGRGITVGALRRSEEHLHTQSVCTSTAAHTGRAREMYHRRAWHVEWRMELHAITIGTARCVFTFGAV